MDKTSNIDEVPKEENNEGLPSEVVYEEGEGVSPEESLRKLRKRLEICVKEKQEYLDGWQRIKAEFVNSQRLQEEERRRLAAFAEERLVEELLPTLESFSSATAKKDSWQSLPQAWRQGMEYVYSQLLGVLEGRGLQVIDPLGEKFNPEKHQAVASLPTSKEEEDQSVAEVLQRGYTLNGKVLKPAQVKIYDKETSN